MTASQSSPENPNELHNPATRGSGRGGDGDGEMICTVEEAKTKWCPFVRSIYVGDHGSQQFPSNRFGTSSGFNLNPEECRCIASDCMAWRWGSGYRFTGLPAEEQAGFCGLAPIDPPS